MRPQDGDPILAKEAAAGRPSVLLCDASGRVLLPLPTEPALAAARKALVEAAHAEASVVVRGCEVLIHEKTLRVRLAAGGTVSSMHAMAIGFMAPLLSAKVLCGSASQHPQPHDPIRLAPSRPREPYPHAPRDLKPHPPA